MTTATPPTTWPTQLRLPGQAAAPVGRHCDHVDVLLLRQPGDLRRRLPDGGDNLDASPIPLQATARPEALGDTFEVASRLGHLGVLVEGDVGVAIAGDRVAIRLDDAQQDQLGPEQLGEQLGGRERLGGQV